VAVGALLALATLLTAPMLLLIITAVAFFGPGRISFCVIYPYGAGSRTFGTVTIVLPALAGFVLTIILVIERL